MELVLGFITSFLVEVCKWISPKMGIKCSRKTVLFLVFVMSLAWTLIVEQELMSSEALQTVLTILSSSIATYELLIKQMEGKLPRK